VTALALALVARPAQAQQIPHYCDTEVGVLGPYPNDGSVHVGDACFGTKNGKRYEGTAVMGRDDSSTGSDSDKGRRRGGDSRDDVPHYCDTEVGVLGPYPNDGSVHVGDACFGTKNGKRYEGTAVMRRDGSSTRSE